MTRSFVLLVRRSLSVGGIALLALMTTVMVPNMATASTNKTQVFEIQNVHEYLTNATAQQETPAVPETDPNIAILQSYLEQKGSPLAPYAEHILQQENWKLVLAISNGESTMCKRQLYNNCWGVGGAWNLRRYASFAEGFSDVNRLITEKYVAEGKDTPAKIARKYVGNYSPNWVKAVSQVLTQLDQLPLVN